ncbi:MAG: NAD(P)-dependent oxidoreductase [Tannerella sp.]|jgi:nucleoside-diphosphate-sugar epimerase|nr:NAD(P)-dependent oxidoreductase [Tannerella sp.]
MEENKKILITGASGFIGGYLVDEALEKGYEVWAGVRKNSSKENFQDKPVHFIDLRYDDREALIRQIRETVELSGKWDYVIHNAGLTKTLNKQDFYKVNAEYTRHLIEALIAADCTPEKFVLMSSLSCFGPVREKSLQPICADDKPQPNTIYGKSKLAAEQFLQQQNHFPYIILRPTGVYGPKDKDYLVELQSINKGFDLKAGFKPQMLTFIYVRDLARAAMLAVENKTVRNKAYFVADGDVHTDAEFSKLVQQILGRKRVLNVRIPVWLTYCACLVSELAGKISGKPQTLNTDKFQILKQRNWMCETVSIWEDLGFSANYNLEEGLYETIHFNKKMGWL